jgi:L-Ala-D/L-Glu epimerase
VKLTISQHELHMRHPFTISRGTTVVQQNLVVRLDEDGLCGYGEACVSSYYGATIENMTAALESVRGRLESRPISDPAALWQELDPTLSTCRFAQNALDQAAWDLWGKVRGQPVWKLWGLSLDRCVPTDYTIGIDTIEKMVLKLRERDGFPFYKVKLGNPNDLDVVRALRKATDAVLRVDANCAWTAEETVEKSGILKDLGVELIEQPLAFDQWEAMEAVRRGSALPIVADESCRIEPDVARCDGLFHGVNIKLGKCGGLTPGRRMLEDARRRGLKTMIGCFGESSVGISAVAQLLPLVDYADLDSALLLAEDVARGVTVDRGRVIFPAENGCGIQWTG